MNIAIDYDDTYTLDTSLWKTFIYTAQIHKHNVYIVTWRDGDNSTMYHEVCEELVEDVGLENIHFTNLKAKRKYMEGKGIYIDVWIDDNPYAILHDGDISYAQQRKQSLW